jgi:hypothetical protein
MWRCVKSNDAINNTAGGGKSAKNSVKLDLKLIKIVAHRWFVFEVKRPVQTGPRIPKIAKDRRPDCGLRSIAVLRICGPNQSWSGPVPVFFRFQDRTSKH